MVAYLPSKRQCSLLSAFIATGERTSEDVYLSKTAFFHISFQGLSVTVLGFHFKALNRGFPKLSTLTDIANLVYFTGQNHGPGRKQAKQRERGTRNAGRKRGLTPVMGQVMHERVVVFWVHSLGIGTMVQEHPDQGQLLGPETVTAIQCHRPTVRDEGTLWEQFLLTSPRLLAPKS